MASYEDKIIILIEAIDKTNQTLADIQKGLKGVKDGAKEASHETMGFGKLLGGITLGNLLSRAITEVTQDILHAAHATLKWSGDMETFGLSITSSLVTGGKYIDQTTGKALKTSEAFGIAREAAKGILQELQAANLQTIATLDQLTRVYVETLPIALQKGFNTGQVKDFTLAVVQAAGAIGLEMDMIAEETRAMLTPSINPRFSRVAVALGLTNEDIRQHSQNAETLFKFLMGKLEGFRLAGELTQRTWRGLWSNLKDIALQAGGVAIEPLFVGIKNVIETFLSDIIRVSEETKKIEWNPEFLTTINNVKGSLQTVLDIINKIKGGVPPETTAAEAERVLALRQSGFTGYAGKTNAQQLATSYGYYTGGENAVTGKIDERFDKNFPAMDISAKDDLIFQRLSKYTDKELQTIIEFAKVKIATEARQAFEKLKRPERGGDSIDTYLWSSAADYGLDPLLLKAIMGHESRGNPLAVNPKSGAMGLMQIMPENVAPYLDKLVASGNLSPDYLKDFGGNKNAAAMDPALNIRMGAMIFSEFNKRFGGDTDKALAGYGGFKTKDPTAYIADIKDRMQKLSGSDLMASSTLQYQGNERMSKSDIEIAKATYDEKLKLSAKHIQAETVILDSNAKRQLAVLEENHAAGLVSETSYYDQKNSITQAKLQKEYDLIDKESDNIYNAFSEGLMANITQPSDEAELGVFRSVFGDEAAIEKERVKVIGLLEGFAAKKISIQNEMAIADSLEGTKKSQLNTKIAEINDQKATSYEEMANKITDQIDAIKVKNDEMLPGDAMVAEHDRQVTAIGNHLQRLLDISDGLAVGGAKWTSVIEDIAKLRMELGLLDTKRPEVKKAGDIATATKEADKVKDLMSQKAAYAELTGQMEVYNILQEEMIISELKFKYAKAAGRPEEQAWIQRQIEFHQENLAFYEQYGPALTGYRDALRETTKEVGSATSQWKNLFKGVFDDLKSGLSTGIYDLLKGNINWSKGEDTSKINTALTLNEAEREKLTLQKEDIQNNDKLDTAQKKQATHAIDLKMKELDANKQLLDKQREAINNSKDAADLFQGFLDKLTQKIADFLASSIIQEFINFLSGKGFGSSPIGGALSWIFGGGGGGGGDDAGSTAGKVVGAGEKLYGWYNKISKAWDWASSLFGGTNATSAGDIGAFFSNSDDAATLAEEIMNMKETSEALSAAAESLSTTTELSEAGLSALEASSGVSGVSGAATTVELSEAGLAALEASSGVTGAATTAITTVELSEAGLAALEASSGVAAGTATTGAAAGGLSPYLAAAGPYIPAVGAALAMYMAYQSMTRDKQPQGLKIEAMGASNLAQLSSKEFLAGKASSQEYQGSGADITQGGTDATAHKMVMASSTDAEKTDYIVQNIKAMQNYREDSKITEAQMNQLINQSLGPMNEGLGEAARAFLALENASLTANAGFELPEKTIKDLKLQFAGMSKETLNAIPNLESFSGILKEIGIDTSLLGLGMGGATAAAVGLEGAIASGGATFSSAGEALLVMVNYLGLSVDQSNALNEVFGGTAATAENVAEKIDQLAIILGISKDAAEALALALNLIPKDITVHYNSEGSVEPKGADSTQGGSGTNMHKGGFVGRFHKGGFLKYHPWGGGIGGDEVPIIAQKGEYVLSKKDVDFIEKVKGGGGSQIVNIPPILPRVNVVVNNQSSTMVQSAGAVRVANDQYIIDVLLKDLHSNGRLRHAFGV